MPDTPPNPNPDGLSHLASVLSIVAEAIISVDESQRIIFFNQGAERIFGHAADEIRGQPLDVLLPDRFRALHREHVAAFARSSITARLMGERMEIRALRRSGEEFPAEASIAKTTGPEGLVLTVVLRDVTEQKRAAERAQSLAVAEAARAAAETAERRMAFLAQASAELASSLDYETTLGTVARLAVPDSADWCAVDVVDANGEVRRLAVHHRDPARADLVAELDARYSPDRDAPGGVLHVIRTGEPEMIPEVPDSMLVRSAMIVPLLVRGEVVGAISFAQAGSGRRYDENDLRRAEDLARRAAVAIDNARLVRELERAVQAKTDFMATVSHELRTPLNAIIGYTELLELGVPASIPTEALSHVQRIGLAGKHLLQLIDEILTFSRLQADREVVEHVPVNVPQLLDEVRAVMGPLAGSRGLAFRLEADRAPDVVHTDPRKLRQILLNLLGNAIKFTDRGRVELEVTGGDDLVVRVTDTGAGIPTTEIPRLFEPFWQGDQTLTRKLGGAGLGLAISARFATLLGGGIGVTSEPGRGSTFTLTLPLTARP